VESVPSTGLDYTVRSGDTLLGIGLRHGIEWQDIALANDMAENDILSIGQVLRLPGRGGAEAAPPSTTLRVSDRTHIVRPSETLWIIAARYGVAWQDVAAVNELGEYSLLQIGQELKLPATEDEEPVDAEDAELTGDASSAPVVKQDASDAETQADAENVAESTNANADVAAPPATIVLTVQSATAAYTVRPGDTLSGIAARHDLTWQALATANDLTESSYLQIGQELAIPGAATEPLRLRQTTGATGGPVAPLPAARAYTVQRGDTIFAIALRSDVDWQELLRVNNLREDSILQPGQTLQLP
jgi:LysM repeat protein